MEQDNANVESDVEENAEEQKENEEAEGEAQEALKSEAGEDAEEAEAFSDDAEEVEEAEEDDVFSLIGDEDTETELEMYKEYLQLLKDIRAQNNLIADLKNQKIELCEKDCKSENDVANIKQLKQNIENESGKLSCMLTKAMFLQNFGSKRRYEYVPVETDLDDDSFGCNALSWRRSTN